MQIRPFGGYLVEGRYAAEVATPPYDALSPAERRRFAEAHPRNYVNTMRSPDEFPGCDEAQRRALLDGNRNKLDELLAADMFRPNPKPCFYIYRLRQREHEQTGLVAQLPLTLYEQGHIKAHEHTTRDKESQLLRYFETVGAASSPVCLAYTGNAAIDACMRRLSEAPPLLDFESPDHLHQSVWRIDDESHCDELRQLFAAIASTYLTDGHHRCAAALRYAREHRFDADDDRQYLLAALFPENQLHIMPYHRCVRDLNGLSSAEFLARLGQTFTITELGFDDPNPRRQGEFSMLLEGRWYHLHGKPSAADDHTGADPDPNPNPVARLDVSVLEQQLLEPLLHITDPRADQRLGYIPGVNGVAGLEARCREGWAVGIACHPTSMKQMMEVADAGCVMPPKSTWFDPKLRSGIFLILYKR